MNQQAPQQTKREERVEAILTVLLIFLIVVAIVLPIVALARGRDELDVTTATTEAPNKPADRPVDPVPSNVVFAGGQVPKMPVVNAATATLSSELHSQYGVIVDVDNGVILAGKGADDQISPASMTKVMSLIVACEKLTEAELTKKITYTDYYADYDYNGLAAPLKPTDRLNSRGDQFLIKDLLYGIGVESAADCVLMIAEYTYGTMDAFVAKMNEKAAALGLTKTHFVDASGDDYPENYTTPVEMAMIMAYAMQCSLIEQILSEDVYKYCGYYYDGSVEKSYNRTFYSTLFKVGNGSSRMDKYEELYGEAFALSTAKDFVGKTGYLDSPGARSFLVCSAKGKTSGARYVAVVAETARFGYTMRDVKTLFDGYAK